MKVTQSAGLAEISRIALLTAPTPVEELPRIRAALGGGPRLLIKRDDAIPFEFGGNKIRKLESVLASNHAGPRPRRPRGWDWPATWW